MLSPMLARIWRVLACTAAMGLGLIHGQTPASLEDTFQALVQGPPHPPEPSPEQLSAVSNRLSAASPDEIRGALPWIMPRRP